MQKFVESPSAPTLQSSKELEEEVTHDMLMQRRGLRIEAPEFFPSFLVKKNVPENIAFPKQYIQPTDSFSRSAARDPNSMLAQNSQIQDGVVLNNITIPDNIAKNEKMMFDLLGNENKVYSDSRQYWSDSQLQQTEEGAYWRTDSPRSRVKFSDGQRSWSAISTLPLSSVQSAADLAPNFEELSSLSSCSLDDEQMKWLEEQLRLANPQSEGYFC